MNAVEVGLPVPPGFRELTIAKDQPEYFPLPALMDTAPGNVGLVVTRWRPSAEELAKLLAGEDVFLSIWTFNNPLQPVRLDVGPPDEVRS